MERSQVGSAVCLLRALLLLTVPGCLSIRGPEGVSGPAGGLVTIGCSYDSEWETYVKWWCRGEYWHSCNILVRTNGSEHKTKRGRLAIQDDQGRREVTVTMEELRTEDEDIYWCGIERKGTDLGHQVHVSVYPAQLSIAITTASVTTEATTLCCGPEADTLEAPTSAGPEPPITWSANSSNLILHSPLTWSLVCNMHFLILTCVKVPLLGGLLCTMMWLNRSRGTPVGSKVRLSRTPQVPCHLCWSKARA